MIDVKNFYINALLEHDKKYFDNFLKILPLYATSESTILDVGAGVGSLVKILRELGYKNSYGVEINSDYVEIGRKRNNLHDCLFTPQHNPFPGKNFDIVLSYTVAEHVDDIQVFVDEKMKYLKSGGLFYLFAPDYHRPKFYWRLLKSRLNGTTEHLTPFSISSTKQLVGLIIKMSFYTIVKKCICHPIMFKVSPLPFEVSVGGDADATWRCSYLDVNNCFCSRKDLKIQHFKHRGSFVCRVWGQ